MARNENPPMGRGELFTWYTDDNGQTVDAAGAAHLEGKEWEFEDIDHSQYGVKPHRSGKKIICRLVRNKYTDVLLPKRFAKYKLDGATADIHGGQVDDYGATVGERGGVVDEFLPAAGAPVDSLFWLVVSGPSYMTTGASGDTNIATGNMVIPTTGGKVIDQDLTVAAGAATFNQINGAIGTALLGVNATDTSIMINVRPMI